jgi:hypothetical protein
MGVLHAFALGALVAASAVLATTTAPAQIEVTGCPHPLRCHAHFQHRLFTPPPSQVIDGNLLFLTNADGARIGFKCKRSPMTLFGAVRHGLSNPLKSL